MGEGNGDCSVRIEFFVPGTPKTAGSKRHIGGGRIIDDCAKGKDWRGDVKVFARQAFNGAPVQDALELRLMFVRQRPTNHYRANGAIKPKYENATPTTKPDVLKLARAVEDALTGLVWKDDAQIVREYLAKKYGDAPGVYVYIKTFEPEGLA